MGLRALLRNLTKLFLLGLGGVLGALVVLWARANDDWVTVHLPAIMAPASTVDLEYESKVWAIVAISFGAGLSASLWLVLAVWLRAVRRERRLALALERLEAQVSGARGLRARGQSDLETQAPTLALPLPEVSVFDEFEELTPEGLDRRLLADELGLPDGYDDPDDLLDDEQPRDGAGQEGQGSEGNDRG